MQDRDFSGGPVVKDSVLIMQRAWVRSLVREITSYVPCGQKNKLKKYIKKTQETEKNLISVQRKGIYWHVYLKNP